jgi:steroid 5-alpha reductase family enzyme
MTLGTLVATNAAIIGGAMVLLWVLATVIRNVSIVDIAWGAGFAVVAAVSLWLAPERGSRAVAVAALTFVWGVRLTAYLAWRNLGHGEDKRYQVIRKHNDPGFWWKSLYLVFAFQGALILLVSLPVQVGVLHPSISSLPLFAAGCAAFGIGLFFETVGDYQLARFKRDPANQGKVMDRGLWRYTRHPNYFGDFMVWWGLFAIAVPDLAHVWIAVGPLVMSVLLLRVSGVTLLESSMKRRPGYAEYIARTSPFFPRPPRA